MLRLGTGSGGRNGIERPSKAGPRWGEPLLNQVRPSVYVGLVHYPVYNKNREVIASAVTNLDIHDLSRLAATYCIERMYVITPLEDQQLLAARILGHWVQGRGGVFNPDRKEALERVAVTASIESAVQDIQRLEQQKPVIVATGASPEKPVVSYQEMRRRMHGSLPHLLLFGTAWGLAWNEFRCDHVVLSPIPGVSRYNHLSVRSAAAIILDRLLSDERREECKDASYR